LFKGLLSKKVYRSYKEYYNITLKEAIKTIKKCVKLTGSKLLLENKFYHKYKLKRSTKLNGFNYGLSNVNCDVDQKGGLYHHEYIISHNIVDKNYNSKLNEFEIKSFNYYNGIYNIFNQLMNKLKLK